LLESALAMPAAIFAGESCIHRFPSRGRPTCSIW
jgi:hypothetical protein